MNHRIAVECPYCKTRMRPEIEVVFVVENYTPVRCEVEEGGCDRVFIVEAKAWIETVCRKLDGQK